MPPIYLTDLLHYLETLLNSTSFDDFCPNGLQVEGSSKIEKIGTAVSSSEKTLQAAIDLEVQALIVHHGLFWNKDSFRIQGSKKRKLEMLLDHNISLLAYHLPLDAHEQYGNNWKAAIDMGWQDLKTFASIGVMGKFPSIPIEQFQKQLEEYYQHPAHTALGGKAKVSTAALISGGAHREITKATLAGVDCFITGSFDEPIWHIAHEENIHFLAMGHANTEIIGPKALGSHLAKHFNIQHTFIDIPNPF